MCAGGIGQESEPYVEKPMMLTRRTMAVLRHSGQFMGLLGSSGPCHSAGSNRLTFGLLLCFSEGVSGFGIGVWSDVEVVEAQDIFLGGLG